MRAELISIGDELLIGQTINTNAAWLGQELSLRGISIAQCVTIPDTENAIHQAITNGFDHADLLILTGGLGPTKDDITKKVIANYFQRELVIDEVTLNRVKAFFESRNRPMLDVNIQQAAIPEGTVVLTNQNGTAPGMWIEHEGKVLISLPGVPYEMKGIMSDEAFPRIEKNVGKSTLFHKTILTQGIGESYIADQLQDWENEIRARGFGLAYLPSPGIVKLRISSPNGSQDEPIIDSYFKIVEETFPKHVYGYGDVALTTVIGNILRDRNATLSTMESCTGGMLASTIVSAPGSSDYFQGSIVSYSNELKNQLLEVPMELIDRVGAVSEEVVIEMAKNGRKKLKTDYAIAISGVAGPSGGTDEKPVGLVWIAIASKEDVITKKFLFANNRERNIQLTVLSALNLLRCKLLGL